MPDSHGIHLYCFCRAEQPYDVSVAHGEDRMPSFSASHVLNPHIPQHEITAERPMKVGGILVPTEGDAPFARVSSEHDPHTFCMQQGFASVFKNLCILKDGIYVQLCTDLSSRRCVDCNTECALTSWSTINGTYAFNCAASVDVT